MMVSGLILTDQTTRAAHGRIAAAMLSPELRETEERRCPTCLSSSQIAPQGHVLAERGRVKVKYRCDACGVMFLVLPFD